jgi:hypothetical protein
MMLISLLFQAMGRIEKGRTGTLRVIQWPDLLCELYDSFGAPE